MDTAKVGEFSRQSLRGPRGIGQVEGRVDRLYLATGNASIATTLHALAGLLRDEGRFREAEPLYRRALEIREKTAGANPRDVVETLKDYALLLRRAGRNGEAAKLDARAAQLQPAK